MGKPRAGAWAGGNGETRLSEVVPGARFIACDDIVVRRCCDDAALCEPGDVFFASIEGLGECDEAVAVALANGASAVVAETLVATGGMPLAIVPDAAWAHARLAHALAGDPARRMRVIAVTGTSGKTTTVWLAASVLGEAGLRVGVVSDLGCLDPDGLEPEGGAVNDARSLAVWLNRLAASGCTHAVVEVSSRMLASQALAGIECDTVVVTNLAEAHLDLHGSKAAYHSIKGRILDSLAADGCLVVNGDDERLQRLVRRCAMERPAAGVIEAGLSRGDLTAMPVERSLFGQTFLMQAAGHTIPVGVTTPIASYVRDALLAAAIGMRYRVPVERVVRGIEAAGSVAGRMERLDRGQDFATFLDRPTSGHALATSLSGLRRLTRGRLILVAEERIAEELGGPEAFANRSSRWCDVCIVAPEGIAVDDPGERGMAAYARIDRELARMGEGDCLLVLGDVFRSVVPPRDPDLRQIGLVDVVDGWLQLAHPPQRAAGRRAA